MKDQVSALLQTLEDDQLKLAVLVGVAAHPGCDVQERRAAVRSLGRIAMAPDATGDEVAAAVRSLVRVALALLEPIA